jgi:HK97 family phage portal protein
MSFIDNILGYFRQEKEVEVVKQKQDEEVGRIIQPIFREIPPNSKAGKFLSEGFRSWAFIAISAIADEVATTELVLYNKKSEDWEPIENHPVLSLLEKPNSFQTKEDFLWLATIYWLSEGEAPIYLNSPKNPTEMVLLNPEKLTMEFDNKKIIGGYKYQQSNGTTTMIPAENVLMLKMPSTASPFRGTGIMKYIAQTLDIDNYIEEYLKLFFFNDTTPGATIETDQELTKSIIERLKNQFTARHQGVKNSHKLAVLEKGLKYHKISSNMNELQLKELNDLIRDKVLAAFKCPKSVLGIVEDVNRANAEASSYSFSRRAVLPKLKMIESQLNQFLLPKFNSTEKLWFEFETPVFQDKLVDAQVWALGVQNGWLTVNEVREEIGLDQLDEEDLIPEIPQEEEETPPEEDEEQGKFAKPKRIREKKRPDALVEIMKDIISEENPEPKKFYSEDELVKFHDDKIMFMNFIERDYIGDLRKNFRRQKRELLKQIEGKSVKDNSLNLQLDADKEVLNMIKLSQPYLYEAIVKESELTYALLGLRGRLTPTSDLVKNFVNKRTIKLGKETTETTQRAIDRIVKDWGEKQGSWTDLRSSIDTYFFDYDDELQPKGRAAMIARTELSNATGFAQQEVYKETGAVGKQWLTATDERVCEECESMNDKYGSGMIVGIGENFFNKGDELPSGETNDWEAVDTPPLHPSCRCDIIPIYEESRSYINEEKYRKKFRQAKKIIDEEKRLKDKDLKLVDKEAEITKKKIDLVNNIEKLEKIKKKL